MNRRNQLKETRGSRSAAKKSNESVIWANTATQKARPVSSSCKFVLKPQKSWWWPERLAEARSDSSRFGH